MTDPAPPLVEPLLSPLLLHARLVCPHCGAIRRFDTRIGNSTANGRAFRCACQAVLGQYSVDHLGNTMLRLATAIDKPAQ